MGKLYIRPNGPENFQAEALKIQGNEALKQQKYQEAIDHYTAAIELDEDNHVLYSNRSAALTHAEKYLEAIKDADKAIQLNPNWAKVTIFCSI